MNMHYIYVSVALLLVASLSIVPTSGDAQTAGTHPSDEEVLTNATIIALTKAGLGASLIVANGFTNNGVIELTATSGGAIGSILTVTNGTLVNAAGGTISALAGTGGSRTLTAQLDNQGTLSLDTALTINKASADHTNSGTIDVSGGNLTLTQSGTTPSFTNSGALTIAGGRTMSVSAGTLIYDGGGVTGGGALTISMATVTLNAGLSNASVAITINSSTVNGPATLTNAAGQTLSITAAGFCDVAAESRYTRRLPCT